MVIRVDQLVIALFPTQDLDRTVCNDFICIHVQRSSGAALDRVYDKLIVQLSGNDLVAGLGNGRCPLLIQLTHLKVGDGRRLFNLRHTVDQFRMHFQPRYIKILISTKRLNPIIGILRHFLFSDRIVLQTIFLFLFLHVPDPPMYLFVQMSCHTNIPCFPAGCCRFLPSCSRICVPQQNLSYVVLTLFVLDTSIIWHYTIFKYL